MQLCATTIFVALQVVKGLALACYPIIPGSAEKIWKQLNFSGSLQDSNWGKEKEAQLKPGHLLGEAVVLFTKIEDKVIAEEIECLNQNLKAQAK